MSRQVVGVCFHKGEREGHPCLLRQADRLEHESRGRQQPFLIALAPHRVEEGGPAHYALVTSEHFARR